MSLKGLRRDWEDLPRHVLDYTEKHYPAYLTPPSDEDFNIPMQSSWDVYKKERKPKAVGTAG